MSLTKELLPAFETSVEGYRIELPQTSRLPDILKLLRENYHKDEPLGKSLRANYTAEDITDEESKLIEEDEDNMIIAVYESSPCLIAIHDETDQVVGVILTVLSRRPETEEDDSVATAALFESITLKSKFVTEYYSYLTTFDRVVNILDKYPEAEAAVELFAIGVHKEHRQKGLAKDLTQTAINLVKKLPGVSVVFGVYTSIYSKKIAEGIGMKRILDIDVEKEFKDADGNPVFREIQPNNIVSVMTLEFVPE